MVGKMIKKEDNKKQLTETEQQLLHEMLETYQCVKIMSRFMKWIVFLLFMFILDFSRLMNALDNSLSHLKKWLTKS
ncbi:hypothetical protein [Bartonella saheliensis]|uniref:hypothetical protein n=1 Tax=Bartonella saheliensis TaxID=1457016 RepID=UPI0011A246D1|nr:hypothetical protein [Bartonella saheliensis]